MMKKNLKKAVSLALASVMALSLTACKGGSGSGTTTAAQAESKEAESKEAESGSEDVTIKFCWWGGDSRHEATEKAVDAFMAKYPNIKVECEYGAWTGWEEKQSLAIQEEMRLMLCRLTGTGLHPTAATGPTLQIWRTTAMSWT